MKFSLNAWMFIFIYLVTGKDALPSTGAAGWNEPYHVAHNTPETQTVSRFKSYPLATDRGLD